MTGFWVTASADQDLSEDFIRDHQDQVIWDLISSCQKLSEEFIIEFKDKVDWSSISSVQVLSESFIYKNSEYIDFYELISNNCLPNYSKKLQLFILEQIIQNVYNVYFHRHATDYMKEQYEKLSIML